MRLLLSSSRLLATTRVRPLSRLSLTLWHRGFATATGRSDERFGFIGLGNMGYPMARNLIGKLSPRSEVSVFDINPQAAAALAAEMTTQKKEGEGARVVVAGKMSDAVKDADIVLTVLPGPAQVSGVVQKLIDDPSLPHVPDRLFIDCSTIDPATSRRVASLLSSAGHGSLIDAPMSGGVRGARAGTLTFMVGCDHADHVLPRVQSVLGHMGARVAHCGEAGAGLAAKLANNYVLAVANVAVAEAMNMGMRAGVDARVLAAVLNASTARCWPSETNNPVPGVTEGAPAGRNYEGGFGLGLMRKDLALAGAAARDAGAKMELMASVGDVYQRVADAEGEGKDFSVVYRYLNYE